MSAETDENLETPRRRKWTIDVTPLRHAAFRRLWIGQGVSFVGFQVTSVAVPVQVYALTHSSFWVGLLGLVNLIPLIVFGLWGGAIADHMDRRALLLISSFIAWGATLMLVLQALLHLDSLWLIMAIVAVQSTGFAISSPARGSIIPRLMPPEMVSSANTLNFTVMQAAALSGPLFAGVILAHFDYSAAYGLDAALFTAGLYASFRLPAIPPLSSTPVATPHHPPRDKTGSPGLRSVIAGFEYLWTQPVLLMSFVVDIIAMVVAMPRALFPELAQTRFDGHGAVGWLYAAIGVGAVLGGLFSGWIGRIHRQGLALIGAIIVWGLAVAASGMAHSLWLAVALLAVGGAADLVSAVFRQTMLQTYAPDEMRGRLQGVFTVVVAGGPRLGDVRAGAVAAAVGAGASWIYGGFACVALVILVGLLSPALLRYDTRTAVGPE